MAEGPIKTGSFFSYQIVIFLVILLWTFMGLEIAQYQLPRLYEEPFRWIAWGLFALLSLIPAITAVTWRMKTRLSFVEPNWDYREQEVSISEYEEIVKQYRKEYQSILSFLDYNLVLLACIILMSAVVIPLLLMRTSFILIAATPIIFGLFVLFFGLVCSSLLFKLIPNDATPHFPLMSVKQLRPSIEMMQKTSGISWTGISLQMGEASGYYTLRNVRPVSRIEGIESVAMIQGTLDESGNVQKLVATLALDESEKPKVIGEISDEISLMHLTEMVYKTIQSYIEVKGADEILDEVLEEVTFFLNRLSDESKASSS